MKYQILGNTDLVCSVLGLGTWGLGGPNDLFETPIGWRQIPDAQVSETIQTALDSGITFFDTSDMYGRGRAEEMLGQCLRGKRHKVILATKGGLLPSFEPDTTNFCRDFSDGYIRGAVHASLRRLNTDYIDLYQLHGPDVATISNDDTWTTLHDLVSEGKIRYFGISLGSRTSHISAWAQRRVASIQARYNLVHIQEVRAIDSRIERVPVIARSIFEHGFLTGRFSDASDFQPSDHRRRKMNAGLVDAIRAFHVGLSARFGRPYSLVEVALSYAITSPNISVTLMGATSSEQVRHNVTIANTSCLSVEEREEITRIAEDIFIPTVERT